MERMLNLSTTKHIKETVQIEGWINARRNMGKIVFLDMRDRSGIVQVVLVPAELDADSQKILSTLRPEFVIQIEGKVQERGAKQKKANQPTGNVEILAKKMVVLAEAETLPYDIDAELNMNAYLENLPFNLRAEKQRAVFKIQAALVDGFRRHLLSKDFIEFQCPKIVANATEGGANVFSIDYFGHQAYLAQSPQFYKQMMVPVFERVFTIGNVYRAEEHDTNRHINEYCSLDFEMGFIAGQHEIMQMLYATLKLMINAVAEHCLTELKLLNASLPAFVDNPPQMKLKEAQKILADEFGEKNAAKEPDLEPHQEKLLGEYARKKWNSDFLFITHYPVAKRPMYTMEDSDDPGFTNSFDLIFRGAEIVTGGQRIHDYETLKKSMKKFGLNPQDFQFYLQAFKYGMPPEGGIGMGLERVTCQLLGLDNIKQATLFPRDQVRIDEVLNKK